ncbi:hypothetical protein C2E23DRAFT_854768 [Lenzites betulinus]|nr:hypothetical protein C2E23DRAFT_854768 [Lenzites betulinus]
MSDLLLPYAQHLQCYTTRRTSFGFNANDLCLAKPAGRYPVLNNDVLLIIMSFCDAPTVLRFVLICRAIYRAGAKYIMSGRQVFIRDQRSFDSFISFLLAHSTGVLYHLHSMHLAVKTVDPCANLFGSILRGSPNLHSLYICHTRDLFASHPDLFDAVTHMPSLRHLALYRCGKLELLGSTSWLVSLTVTYINPDPFLDSLDDREGVLHHPMFLCAPLQFKLEELDIQYSRRYGAHFYNAPYVFHKLKKLTLYDGAPYIRGYLSAFPNLTHLTITCDHRPWADIDHFIQDWEEHRELNLGAQELDGSWTQLEHLTADVCALYLLALSCPVARLTIRPVDEPAQLRLLIDVLHEVKPKRLDMTVNMEVLSVMPQLFFEVAPELGETRTLLSVTLAVAISPLYASKGYRPVSHDLVRRPLSSRSPSNELTHALSARTHRRAEPVSPPGVRLAPVRPPLPRLRSCTSASRNRQYDPPCRQRRRRCVCDVANKSVGLVHVLRKRKLCRDLTRRARPQGDRIESRNLLARAERGTDPHHTGALSFPRDADGDY